MPSPINDNFKEMQDFFLRDMNELAGLPRDTKYTKERIINKTPVSAEVFDCMWRSACYYDSTLSQKIPHFNRHWAMGLVRLYYKIKDENMSKDEMRELMRGNRPSESSISKFKEFCETYGTTRTLEALELEDQK